MRIIEALKNRYEQKDRKLAEANDRYVEELKTLDPETFIRRLHAVKKYCDYGRNIAGGGLFAATAPIPARDIIYSFAADFVIRNFDAIALASDGFLVAGITATLVGLRIKQMHDHDFKLIEAGNKRRLIQE